jgi:hypothetical protein
MVYDCFTFFNELDLLEIRLKILNDYVDYFIISEADMTYSGIAKEYILEKNIDRFNMYQHKIIYIKCEFVGVFNDAWARENHQRSLLMYGIDNLKTGDVILIGDLDEIPNPDRIKEVSGMTVFHQYLFNYFMDNLNKTESPWKGTIGIKLTTDFQKLDPQKIRDLRFSLPGIEDGGWHWTYLGGVDRIVEKIKSFSHTEYNEEKYLNKSEILKKIRERKDVYNRSFEYFGVDIEKAYPEKILNIIKDYPQFLKAE